MCTSQTYSDHHSSVTAKAMMGESHLDGFNGSAAFGQRMSGDAETVGGTVQVPMAEGVSDSYFVHPKVGQHPAILIWPDVFGPRPAYEAMAQRLASEGYAVLVVNPFYRETTAPFAEPKAAFANPDTFDWLMEMLTNLDQHADTLQDARDYMGFLDKQDCVDTARKAGTAGYCMGGRLVIRTAAALPDRIGAVASFHGANMANGAPDSPHLLIPQSTAPVLHALAKDDDEKDPDGKSLLVQAYAAAGLGAEIEVYDALHGWCPPDTPAYHEAEAERAWSRMLALFSKTLR